MHLIIKDLVEGLTAFGSTAFYGFVIVLSLIYSMYILAAQLIIAYVLSLVIVVIIKSVYFRERPKKMKAVTFLEKMGASSFPSLHSMRVIMLAIFCSVSLQNFYVTILSIVLVVVTGVTRVVMKRHYVTDVFAGFLFGAVLALVMIIV
ncbi:MAG: phosphatase PAP2 family protein [archaeon]